MKKQICVLFCLMMAVIGICVLRDQNAYAEVYNVDVTEEQFGADGSDEWNNGEGDDQSAIQSALNLAMDNEDLTTVIIPAGTYYIGDTLHVWSNTKIVADGATLICEKESGNMLNGYHRDTNEDGTPGSICAGLDYYSGCNVGGYDQLTNVTIEGGTWDRNSSAKQNTIVLSLKHGNHITIRNATFMNSTNHLLNLSGDSYVTVSGCTFKNNIKYTGDESKFWSAHEIKSNEDKEFRYSTLEAIHLDFINKEGEPTTYPQDGTPCMNVTVQNCTFSNVGAGVGTHSAVASGEKKGSKIKVIDCSFSNIWGHAANFYSFTGCVFSESSMKKITAAGICRIVDSTATVSNVTLPSVNSRMGPALYVTDASTATVKNVKINGTTASKSLTNLIYAGNKSNLTLNTVQVSNAQNQFAAVGVVSSGLTCLNSRITGSKTTSICAKKATRVNVQKCTITDTSKTGFYVENSKNVTIKGNTIKSTKTNGLYLKSTPSATVSGNIITSAGSNGIYMTGCNSAVIQSNKISAAKSNGISVNSAKSVRILNNTVTSAAVSGIYVKSVSGVTVKKGTVSQPAKFGLYAYKAPKLNVSHVTFSAAKNVGAYVENSSKATIQYCIFKNSKNNSIYAKKAAYLNVHNCKITDAAKTGFFVESSKKAAIKKNTIKSTKSNGLYLKKSPSATVYGNKISRAGSNGIYTIGCNSPVISTNKISAPKSNGISVNNAKYGRIYGNTVTSAKVSGIYVNGVSSMIVKKDYVNKSACFGLYAYKASKISVSYSKFYHTKNIAVYVAKSSKAKVHHNTCITKVKNGIYLKSCSGSVVKSNKIRKK